MIKNKLPWGSGSGSAVVSGSAVCDWAPKENKHNQVFFNCLPTDHKNLKNQ